MWESCAVGVGGWGWMGVVDAEGLFILITLVFNVLDLCRCFTDSI